MVIVYEHELINCGSLPDFEKNLREKMSLDSAEIWISGNGTSDGKYSVNNNPIQGT